MSTTTNSFTTGSLTFGSVPPTSTNQFDDDTYVVTSNGTSTGTPTAIYKFDAETNAWVLMPTGGANDFWRATVGDTLPDGVTDVTEGIYHDGTIHIGNANRNAITRFSHLGIVSYTGNGTFTTQTIQTNIPANSTIMPTIYVKGYAYEAGNTIDLQLGMYTYNVPLDSIFQPVWSSSGSTKPTQVRMAYIGGLLAIELVWATTNDYFQRWEVSAYCDGNGATNVDAFFEGWTISNTPIPVTATTITVIPDKTAFSTVICPAPMTRAELIALRTAGGLVKDCDYVVTDFVQGRLLAGTLLHFQAIDASTLSMNVEVKTLFDNVGWAGIYDIDANRFIELRDSIGNIVRDSTSTRVTAFDWGNPAYTRCYFEDATVTYTYGLATLTSGLRIINSAANLTRVGGTIIDTTVSGSSTLTLTGANFVLTRVAVTNGSTFNATNYVGATATWSDVVIKDISTVTLAGTGLASATRSSIGRNTNFTNNSTGVLSLTNSQINSSAISRTGGSSSFLSSEIENVVLTHSGAGAFSATRSSLAHSAITLSGTGGVSFNLSETSSNASITNASVANLSILASSFEEGSTLRMIAGSNSITSVNNSKLAASAIIDIRATSTAGNASFSSKNTFNGAVITKTGTGSLVVSASNFDSNASIALSNARSLDFNQVNVGQSAVVSSTSTATGIDSITNSVVTQSGRITYSQTGTRATTLQTSKISGNGSFFSLSGTTSGGLYRNVEITSNGSVVIANASANFLRFRDVVVANGASFTVQNVAVAHSINQINLTNSARMTVSSTTAGTIQYVTMANSCSYTMTGTASCSNVQINGSCIVTHTGGSLLGLFKTMGGVLTIPFNQTNIYHHTSTNTALTAINNNRGRDLFNNSLV